MTCIVGVAHKGGVMLGADSIGVSGWDKKIRRDRKVFVNGELLFGFTSSFRMGQLLEFNLTPPAVAEGEDPYSYAVRALIPAVRDTLKAGGYAKTDGGRETGGAFMIGFRGRLFTVEDDYQVAENVDDTAALGAGNAYALGAMHALGPGVDPKTRLTAGLQAAADFSIGVAGPFHFIELAAKEAFA